MRRGMITRPPIDTLMNRKNESLRSDWRAVVPRDAGTEYAADPVDSAPSCAHRRAEEREKKKGAEQRKPGFDGCDTGTQLSHG